MSALKWLMGYNQKGSGGTRQASRATRSRHSEYGVFRSKTVKKELDKRYPWRLKKEGGPHRVIKGNGQVGVNWPGEHEDASQACYAGTCLNRRSERQWNDISADHHKRQQNYRAEK